MRQNVQMQFFESLYKSRNIVVKFCLEMYGLSLINKARRYIRGSDTYILSGASLDIALQTFPRYSPKYFDFKLRTNHLSTTFVLSFDNKAFLFLVFKSHFQSTYCSSFGCHRLTILFSCSIACNSLSILKTKKY